MKRVPINPKMVDVAAITVAIISLLASIATGALTAYTTIYADKLKDARDTEKLLRKYREPLLLAAQDLQRRPPSPNGRAQRGDLEIIIASRPARVGENLCSIMRSARIPRERFQRTELR